MLATGGGVHHWDLATVKPIKTLTNVLGAVNDPALVPTANGWRSPEGSRQPKGDLRLYRVADWKLLAVLGGHEDVVNSVAFSADGQWLAWASFDKTVRLWNLATFKQEKVFTDHADFVYAVAFAPDGKWLASASKDRSVKVFDLATGKSRLTFSGMNEDVMAVAISPDGQAVVSSGGEPALYWWNPKTGDKVRMQAGHGVGVQELCFSRDGKIVASAGGDGSLRTWNAADGKPLRSMMVGSLVYACGLSPDGKVAVSGSFDGLVRIRTRARADCWPFSWRCRPGKHNGLARRDAGRIPRWQCRADRSRAMEHGNANAGGGQSLESPGQIRYGSETAHGDLVPRPSQVMSLGLGLAPQGSPSMKRVIFPALLRLAGSLLLLGEARAAPSNHLLKQPITL